MKYILSEIEINVQFWKNLHWHVRPNRFGYPISLEPFYNNLRDYNNLLIFGFF